MKPITFAIICLVATAQCEFISLAAVLQTVALTGAPIPGAPGKVFGTLGWAPTINNSGQVAFLDDTGIWTNAGPLGGELIATGSAAPGAGDGVRFQALGAPTINDPGQLAFAANIDTGSGAGVWFKDNSQLTLVALRGQDAPGFNGEFKFVSIYACFLNNSGGIAFNGTALNKRNIYDDRSAIWFAKNGILHLAVTQGQTVPANPPTAFTSTLHSYAFNDVNEVTFVATLGGAGGHDFDSGIWQSGGNSIKLVVQESYELSGRGDFWLQDTKPAVNNTGHVAYSQCSSSFACTEGGIWLYGNGSLTALAAHGRTVSYLGNSYTFSGLFGKTVLNSRDEVAFLAQYTDNLTDINKSGIWLSSSGELKLIAALDATLPGWSFAVGDQALVGLSINSRGQVAFSTSKGIWATDPGGALRSIALVGDQLDVDDGPGVNLKTIQHVAVNLNGGDQDWFYKGFNNDGAIAFRAHFTDDYRGIFVSSVAAVPEPPMVVLSSIAALILLYLPPRKR